MMLARPWVIVVVAFAVWGCDVSNTTAPTGEAVPPPAAAGAVLPPGEIVVFDDREAFLAATGAEPVEPFPNLGLTDTPWEWGGLTFSLGPDATELYVGTLGVEDPYGSTWHPLIDGHALAVHGLQDLDVDLSSPVHALGYDFVEPTDPALGGSSAASIFEVTLLRAGGSVGSFSYTAPKDVLTFIGVLSGSPFDRIEIHKLSGSAEVELFGQFFVDQSAATPQEEIRRIIELIEAMHLDRGTERSLLATLESALRSLELGNETAACAQLDAFVNRTDAAVRSGQLPAADGQELIHRAEGARDGICG